MISLIENGRLLHVTDPLSMLQVLCPQFRVAAKFVSTFRGTVYGRLLQFVAGYGRLLQLWQPALYIPSNLPYLQYTLPL